MSIQNEDARVAALHAIAVRKYPPGPGINTLCMDELAAELLTWFAVYGIKYLSDDHLEILFNALDRECFRRNGGPVEV